MDHQGLELLRAFFTTLIRCSLDFLFRRLGFVRILITVVTVVLLDLCMVAFLGVDGHMARYSQKR
jgi:hypothetical protein